MKKAAGKGLPLGCDRETIGAAAHDLRTPLLAIRMGCDLLERGVAGQDPGAREILKELRQAGSELGAMAERALAFARLEAGLVQASLAPTDLAAVAEQAAAGARAAAGPRTVGVTVSAPAALPPALADPALLRQVLTELLDNAVAFSPDGQQVAVLIGEGPGSPRPLRVRVADQGPGVPAALAGAIFSPWVRVRAPGRGRTRGLGLGLALARRLCLLMGARVALLPGEGPGAVFEVALRAAVPRR